MESLTIKLRAEPKQYRIHIGYGELGKFCGAIARAKYGNRLAVITDSTVNRVYGKAVMRGLESHGADAELFTFPAGEKYKTRETKAGLEDRMFEREFGRDSAVIALGGGVVGDLAGFLAATYMRGIPVIQVPTTVIAQGDSSIGGKTGVEVPAGKNLVGVFYNPVDIYMDVKTLETLDARNYSSGLAEIIKHGLIWDRKFFEFLVRNRGAILGRKGAGYGKVMAGLMKRNCAIKNAVVQADATEKNLRKILNYGHTIAHAVEPLSGYSLTHGECVSIGMACEAFLSASLGHLKWADYEEQVYALKAFGLPTEIPWKISTQEMMKAMHVDKKARKRKPQFVLLERIGKTKSFGGQSATGIEEGKLRALIDDFRSA